MLLCTPTALSPANLTASSPTNLTASPPSNPTASPPLTLTTSHLPNLTASVFSLHLSSLPSPELTALPPTNFTACPLPHLTASFPLSSAHPHCPSSTQSPCLASPQTSSAPPPILSLLHSLSLPATTTRHSHARLITVLPTILSSSPSLHPLLILLSPHTSIHFLSLPFPSLFIPFLLFPDPTLRWWKG